MLASAATLFALVFGLTKGMSYGWTSPLVLGSFAAAAAGLGIFILIEQRREEPLLELALFRSPNLSGANAVSLLPPVSGYSRGWEPRAVSVLYYQA